MSNADLKILLVDDYPMVRTMLRTGLADMGYTNIGEADDGNQALALLHAAAADGKPYDLVFCDWVMPEMEGIEVLENCRSSQDLKNVAFVMVTAEAEQSSILRAMKAGATDYILKPISTGELKKKMRILLLKLNKQES